MQAGGRVKLPWNQALYPTARCPALCLRRRSRLLCAEALRQGRHPAAPGRAGGQAQARGRGRRAAGAAAAAGQAGAHAGLHARGARGHRGRRSGGGAAGSSSGQGGARRRAGGRRGAAAGAACRRAAALLAQRAGRGLPLPPGPAAQRQRPGRRRCRRQRRGQGPRAAPRGAEAAAGAARAAARGRGACVRGCATASRLLLSPRSETSTARHSIAPKAGRGAGNGAAPCSQQLSWACGLFSLCRSRPTWRRSWRAQARTLTPRSVRWRSSAASARRSLRRRCGRRWPQRSCRRQRWGGVCRRVAHSTCIVSM